MCDMALMFRNGDYVSDGAAGLSRVTGREALLQRVLFRLTARRGTFPFCGTLGSRLWQLGQLPAHARQTAARQYVTEERRCLHSCPAPENCCRGPWRSGCERDRRRGDGG